MCASDSKGAREESAQAGAEAVRRRARKQRHRNNRVGSVCGCIIHQEMGSTEKTIDFSLMILLRWKFTDPSVDCRSATMMPGMGGQRPLCPCLLRCTAQAILGGLHPSIFQGNASNHVVGESTPQDCRTAQAHSPSSHGRCQCFQALPGSRDLLLLCLDRIFQKMCMRWQKSLSGKKPPVGTVGQAE